MTLGKAAAAQVRLIVWWPASGRAGPGRDGCSVRRRHQRSRLAREACLFALRPTAGRYGRDRDRASVGYGSNQIALASTGSSTDDAWYPSGCRLGVETGPRRCRSCVRLGRRPGTCTDTRVSRLTFINILAGIIKRRCPTVPYLSDATGTFRASDGEKTVESLVDGISNLIGFYLVLASQEGGVL